MPELAPSAVKSDQTRGELREDLVRFQMAARLGHPDFLDLPWHLPLTEWESERLVEIPRGIARHVVRFVDYDGSLYALKELAERPALHEYRMLRHLGETGLPVVEVVGLVTDRSEDTATFDGSVPAADLDAVLITRHLDFSLPYRTLFTGRGVPNLRTKLLDALAHLLVQFHVDGFFWGDCSLSNTLFRRDAGALRAYLVDAETGELHPDLTDGQREYDLTIAKENLAGELMDIEAGYGLPGDLDPIETAIEVIDRYEALWSEVNREETLAVSDRYLIEVRLRRLNELGFDVDEMELVSEPDGRLRLRVQPKVVERGHHRNRLLILTGLDVQENQARRLLNDIDGFRVYLEQQEKRSLPESVVAFRWLNEVFEPTIAAIPPDLRGKLEPAELFHEILEHRWLISEAAGRDVGMEAALRSYIDNVLRYAPSERKLLPVETGEMPAISAGDLFEGQGPDVSDV
jgi:Domain of unknown function (DUF4032)